MKRSLRTVERPTELLIRHAAVARVNHWITGGCFVLLLLSGLSMFHPMLFWLSNLFGGGQWTRAVHPWIGIVLVVSYAGMIVQFWRDNLPSRDDVAWTRALPQVLQNEEAGVPEVPRFNTGQKFVFWAMALLVPVLFFTGLVAWEVYFGSYTTIEQQRIALLVHSLGAIAAILVWIGIAFFLSVIPAHIVWLFERRHNEGIIQDKAYFPGIFQALYWTLSSITASQEATPRQWFARLVALL